MGNDLLFAVLSFNFTVVAPSAKSLLPDCSAHLVSRTNGTLKPTQYSLLAESLDSVLRTTDYSVRHVHLKSHCTHVLVIFLTVNLVEQL